MKIAFIVPADEETISLAIRTIDSIPEGDADEALLVWHGASDFQFVIKCDRLPVRIVRVPLSQQWSEVEWVRAGLMATYADWAFVLRPGESIPKFGHVSIKAAERFMTPSVGDGISDQERSFMAMPPGDTPTKDVPSGLRAALDCCANGNSVALCVIWTQDSEGNYALAWTIEGRGIRRGTPWGWDKRGFIPADGVRQQSAGISPVLYLANYPVLHQPVAAALFEMGDHQKAMEIGQRTQLKIDRRIYIKARAAFDRLEALRAFRVLYDHMSIHEELWRLGEILKHLPYTIDDDSLVDECRKLYEQQVGHLKNGEEAWYRDGSPGEVINEDFVRHAAQLQTVRCRWIADEARARGFKRIVEFGSLDGMNLFQWAQLIPDVEVHGIEINPKAVAHARSLAEKTGVPIHIHLGSFHEFATSANGLSTFDAAMVFEVLEHNSPDAGQQILTSAEQCVRSSGRIYITTPLGAWSLHDEATRSVPLRKDHILAWTAKRMRVMLEKRGARDIVVTEVENPQFQEANAWVHASYERPP